jgi:hypothetical protein
MLCSALRPRVVLWRVKRRLVDGCDRLRFACRVPSSQGHVKCIYDSLGAGTACHE